MSGPNRANPLDFQKFSKMIRKKDRYMQMKKG